MRRGKSGDRVGGATLSTFSAPFSNESRSFPFGHCHTGEEQPMALQIIEHDILNRSNRRENGGLEELDVACWMLVQERGGVVDVTMSYHPCTERTFVSINLSNEKNEQVAINRGGRWLQLHGRFLTSHIVNVPVAALFKWEQKRQPPTTARDTLVPDDASPKAAPLADVAMGTCCE
jgi:hypothetical protein